MAGSEIADRRLSRSIFTVLILVALSLAYWMDQGYPYPGGAFVLALVAAFVLEWGVFEIRRLWRRPVFESLASRREPAAVPILLELEDYHPTWPEAPRRLNAHRLALVALAPVLNPEQFGHLADRLVIKLCGLAFYPDSILSSAALSTLERAGDGRAVRALAQLRFEVYKRRVSPTLDAGLDTVVRAISERAQQSGDRIG
jgi:hypothetical protein